MTRKRLDGTDGEGWHPEYAVSRADALRMLTLWPAFAAFQEDHRGSLRVGNYADLTVLDRDIMTVAPAEILEARTVMTMVGGRVTYAATP